MEAYIYLYKVSQECTNMNSKDNTNTMGVHVEFGIG